MATPGILIWGHSPGGLGTAADTEGTKGPCPLEAHVQNLPLQKSAESMARKRNFKDTQFYLVFKVFIFLNKIRQNIALKFKNLQFCV